MSIRVFLLDDHVVVRRGLSEVLAAQKGIDLVGEASTLDETLRRVPEVQPDVAMLDVLLPDGSGVEACREIRSRHPTVRCLMFTSFPDDDALVDSIMAGAAGYLLKRVGVDELVDGIRRVAAGQSLLDPAVTATVLDHIRHPPGRDEPISLLTDQEGKVLDLLAQGLTNRQIGEQLFLAEKTVKNYVSAILTKLGMQRRTEAAAFAARRAERDDPTQL